MEWIERLNEAVEYIETNLENKIDYGEASKIKPNLLVMYHQLYMIDTINGNDSELSNKIEEVEKEIIERINS